MLLKEALVTFILIFKFCLCDNLNCGLKGTCSECIQELGCKWCSDPANGKYCLSQNVSNFGWCKNTRLISDPRSSAQVLSDQSFSDEEDNSVQLKPQRMKLTLRKGQQYTLNFQYKQAENYPVDLYYIMDLSASMDKHREKLGKLGNKLAQTMTNKTKKLRMGFGSFVDKVDLPFTSTVPAKLKKPCTHEINGESVACAPPYSFKNHMSLSPDYAKFTNEVTHARVSGNLDAPEGGFDALMQAMVCKNEIGWRSSARHLLVFSSDAEFHIAGDGRLVGVVEPNDATCHMKDNAYTHDLVYDYPSVSQINYIARENNINIVFAVAKKPTVVESYKKLCDRIENSNSGVLDETSENVIDLVLDNYNKIVNSVTMYANSSNDVEVKISSTCQHAKENGCTNVRLGETVNFTALIKPLECTSGSNTKTITIKPEGIEETISIDLEVLCECDCSQGLELNSPSCSNQGNLKCGVCDCRSGRFGRKCECNNNSFSSQNETICIAPGDTKICSGLGVCECGKCKCDSKPNGEVYGTYCECDNYSCKRTNGVVCSNKGTCGCGGMCTCYPGWAGDACQCPDTNSTCVKPGGDGFICNGHGACNCGKCECFDEAVRYSGRFCDECPTCAGQRCEELKPCVECRVFKSDKCKDDFCLNLNIEKVDKVKKDEEDDDDDIKVCTILDQDGCTFVFSYEYDKDNKLMIKAEKKKACSEPPPVLAWVLGVIGTIFLAGILMLIIWKICTTYHDRREYAKFENERQKLKWHRSDNPLYKQATSTFANPVYNKANHRYSFKNK